VRCLMAGAVSSVRYPDVVVILLVSGSRSRLLVILWSARGCRSGPGWSESRCGQALRDLADSNGAWTSGEECYYLFGLIVEIGCGHRTKACEPVASLYSDGKELLEVARFLGVAGDRCDSMT
jgi:hypothetical protein